MSSEEPTNLPIHIGFILDGNRRWAQANNLPQLEGHRRGYENLKTVAEAAFERGVFFVSAYIFSTENWNRSKQEVTYLMDLALLMFKKDLHELLDKGYRVLWLGIPDGLSKRHLKAIAETEEKSKNNKKGTIGVCFNYGGQQEIADAAAKLAKEGNAITPESIGHNLYAPEMPPMDLVIRTSGEQRLSNFMLWRAAYSELYFVNKHWPDFGTSDLDQALADYAQRKRRFGK